MQKDIRLVVSDIDGTIIQGREAFPPILTDVVGQLRERGILFTFASGRLPCRIDPYLKLLGITGPVIACNGTLIYEKDRILSNHDFMLGELRGLIGQALSMDMTVLYAVCGVEYCALDNDSTRRKREERGSYHPIRLITEADWQSLRVDKVNILDDALRIGVLEPEVQKVLSCSSVTHYGSAGLEIVKAGYSKATGLKEITARLGLNTSQVLAIGDNENDNEILRLAGIGAAVGNAKEETKYCADYVSDSCGAEGVADAIRRFCL